MEVIMHLDKDKFEQVIIQRDEKGNPTNNKIIKKAGVINLTKEIKYWPKKDINKFGLKIISLI